MCTSKLFDASLLFSILLFSILTISKYGYALRRCYTFLLFIQRNTLRMIALPSVLFNIFYMFISTATHLYVRTCVRVRARARARVCMSVYGVCAHTSKEKC